MKSARISQFLACFQHQRPTHPPTGGAATILSTKSTWDLLVATSIFTLCRFESLVNPVIGLLRDATENAGAAPPPSPLKCLLRPPLLALTKHTAFAHFCAGETFSDCQRSVAHMQRSHVSVLLDHSVEERESSADWSLNVANKIKLLHQCHDNHVHILGIPVKPTAMISPHVLETMTQCIVHDENGDYDTHRHYADQERDPLPRMSAHDLALYDEGFANLSQVCQAAAQCNISILLDAEQSHRQPAIDFICRRLQRTFNQRAPIVWNTYQMYMQCSGRRLVRDLQDSHTQGYRLSAKIVRGAYVMAEQDRSKNNVDWPYALWGNKEQTDRNYDASVATIIASIAAAENSNNAASIVIATHNRDSVEHALACMETWGLDVDDSRINFAQIMGMCDVLTLALGSLGYNSHKLILFGEFMEIFPWLLRRLDENKDMLGAAQLELDVLVAELKRRIVDPVVVLKAKE
jgi:hypothetical protein